MKHIIPYRELIPLNPTPDQISDLNITLNNLYNLIQSADDLIIIQEDKITTNNIIIILLFIINAILIISIFTHAFI